MDRVNDFAFKIATANGTGSASANGLIMQAIFRMGVPVTGKNVFPSNIQGLPTWYEIRVSKDGYTARTPHFDLMVALNPATYAEGRRRSPRQRLAALRLDLAARRAAEAARRHLSRRCRSPRCATRAFKGVRERILMKNIAYAGALAALLDMDTDDHPRAAQREVRRQAGVDGLEPEGRRPWLQLRRPSTSSCPLPIHLDDDGCDEGLDPDRRQHVGGAWCLYAGATVGAWYPITPATSLMEAFPRLLQEVPARSRDEEESRLHPAGRRRARRHRHGDRRRRGPARARSRRRPGRASR